MSWLTSTKRGRGEAGKRGPVTRAAFAVSPRLPASPLARLSTELHHGNGADPHNGFAHFVVGRRGASRNADSTSRPQPFIAPGFRLGADGLVANHSGGYIDGVGVLDVVDGNAV